VVPCSTWSVAPACAVRWSAVRLSRSHCRCCSSSVPAAEERKEASRSSAGRLRLMSGPGLRPPPLAAAALWRCPLASACASSSTASAASSNGSRRCRPCAWLLCVRCKLCLVRSSRRSATCCSRLLVLGLMCTMRPNLRKRRSVLPACPAWCGQPLLAPQ